MSDILLPYQRRALKLIAAHPVTVIEKSRRIGLTWAVAADAVLTAAAVKTAGGMDVYYLAYEKEMTREFIDTCATWAKMVDQAASEVEEFVFKDSDKDILAFRLHFASGFNIIALSSTPRGLRGRQGKVIIDEAAFHDNLDEVLKAALALLIWGGKVIVLSTHDGADNPFYRLVANATSGQTPHGHLRITFDDALKDGLYHRICATTGQVWSAAAETQWREEIIAQYGEGADEELFCLPRQGGGSWIDPADIERAVDPEAGRPDLYRGGLVYLGNDIARRNDRWVLTVLERVGEQLILREEIVLANERFSVHEDLIGAAMTHYRVLRLAMDQTGMGEVPVERALERYGTRVEGVVMSGPRRLAVATAAKQAFEDGTLKIPNDPALKADLRKLRRVAGPTGAPRLMAGRDSTGHADRAWALFLALAAANGAAEEYAYHPVPSRGDSQNWLRPTHDDEASRRFGRGTW